MSASGDRLPAQIHPRAVALLAGTAAAAPTVPAPSVSPSAPPASAMQQSPSPPVQPAAPVAQIDEPYRDDAAYHDRELGETGSQQIFWIKRLVARAKIDRRGFDLTRDTPGLGPHSDR